MRTPLLAAAALACAALLVFPALAADKKEAPKDKGPAVRYQHTYEAALQEAKERGCVILAFFHIDH